MITAILKLNNKKIDVKVILSLNLSLQNKLNNLMNKN